MKPVRYHRDARFELEEAVAYYEARSRGLGLDFLASVENATRRIASDPTRWRSYKATGLRCLSLRQFPFTIFYLEMEVDIWIAAVAHMKRRPGYWERRKPEQP